MKIYLFLIIPFLQANILFSQSHFILSGRTNLVKNGRVVLLRDISNPLNSSIVKADTVEISNYAFKFEGNIIHPEEHRLLILRPSHISEPFFIDKGIQEIRLDSGSKPHDLLDVGCGVSMKGSRTNDEYINDYLSRFSDINKKRDLYYSESDRCDTITDLEIKKICLIKSHSMLVAISVSSDSVLLNYTSLFPQSKITPWLLYDAMFYYGYNNIYQKTFDKIERSLPLKIKVYLDSILTRHKMTAVGSLFPLVDYINSNVSAKYIQKNKYTLVDFWFTKCRPCLGQFELLRDLYKQNSNNGFDLVAISIDRLSDIPEYEKLLKQKNYKWKQVLDTGAVQAKFLSISKYPTNFLLDTSGKIIAVDIKPFMLEEFLKENLL